MLELIQTETIMSLALQDTMWFKCSEGAVSNGLSIAVGQTRVLNYVHFEG